MDKIFLYCNDDVDKILSSKKSAVLSFSENPVKVSCMLKRAESLDGGISQIKRWISTSSFSLILIEGISSASAQRDISSFLLWLKDHAEDYDGPYIIIREKESNDGILKIAREVDDIETLSINIR